MKAEKSQTKLAKRLVIWAVVVAGILMLPLVTGAPWTSSDYVFGAIALFGSATIFEVATRNVKDPKRRYAIGGIVLFVLLLLWGYAALGD